MDCYLVDILYLSEAFWGAKIGNCDIKQQNLNLHYNHFLGLDLANLLNGN